MIDMNHKYQTRDGRAVRVLAIDEKSQWSVVGRIMETYGKETLNSWMADGKAVTFDNSPLDLVPVPTKHEAWAVVIDDHVFPGPCMVFNTKEGAEHHAEVCAGRLVYVAHVTWED